MSTRMDSRSVGKGCSEQFWIRSWHTLTVHDIGDLILIEILVVKQGFDTGGEREHTINEDYFFVSEQTLSGKANSPLEDND
jgi:hypothetical protein